MQRVKGLAQAAYLACESFSSFRPFSTIPAGHRTSDLRQHVCNVSLNRRRDITLRRDVTLSNSAGCHSLSSLLKGRVIVLFGLPDMGSVCKKHLGSYLDKVAALREEGVSKIFCVAVGSPSEVEGWYSKAASGSKADSSSIEPLADEEGAFVRMLGMNIIDAEKPALKNHRFAALVDDGILLKLKVEESPADVQNSSADAVIEFLKDMGSLRAAAAP